MFCKNCGTKIEGEMKFCPSCGTVVDDKNEESKVELDNNQSKMNVSADTVISMNDNMQMNNPVSYQSTFMNDSSVASQNTYENNSNIQSEQNSAMQQPMYNQPYINSTNNEKKNNSIVFIIVGIVVAFIACVGIIIYSNNKNDNKSKTNSNSNIASNSNSSIMSNSNSNIISNSNSNTTSNYSSNLISNSNITSNTAPTTNAVTFKGYVFQVPSNYKVQTTTSQLQLIGTNNIDVAAINIQSGSFESIKASKETINSYMTNAGYTVSNIKINYYNGVEFVTAEIAQGTRKMILGYAKLNATTIFMVVTGNTNNILNYNALNDIAPMITTARVAS